MKVGFKKTFVTEAGFEANFWLIGKTTRLFNKDAKTDLLGQKFISQDLVLYKDFATAMGLSPDSYLPTNTVKEIIIPYTLSEFNEAGLIDIIFDRIKYNELDNFFSDAEIIEV